METVTFEWHSSHSIKRDESGRSVWMLRSLWSYPSCTVMCQKLLPKDFGLSCEPEWSNWAAFQCCFSVLTLNGRSVLHPNWEIQTDTLLTCCFGFAIVFEPFGNRKGEQVPLSKSKTTLGQDLTYKQTNKQNQPWQKQTTRERRTIQQWTVERLAKVPALVHRMCFLVCFLWSVFIGWVLFWVVSYSATEGVIFG